MLNNISEKAEKACSGCGACSSICPENAIQLKIDDIGFVTASVNESVCIDCGLCKKVCYRFNDIASESAVSLYDSSLFALQSSNGDIVKKCSSGGVAHAIAEEVLAQGGAAVGVAYRYEDNTAIHRIIENAEELSELDGSKYIQSNPHDAFAEAVKQALSDHTKQFAVFGTPCQIAGLNKVLRQKKIREQFLLTEIFCHGVPSYLLWENEVERISKKLGTNHFDSLVFRFKRYDWHSYYLRAKANGKTFYGARERELFWQVYFENILLGDACYSCEARKEKSCADLRIGDFWGRRFQDRTDGVSAVFACTEMGKAFINHLIDRGKLTRFECADAAEMLSAQNMGGYMQKKLHDDTMSFFKETNSIRKAIKYYRTRMTGNQKLKRYLIVTSSFLPNGIRIKFRKASSGRLK